MAGERPWWGPSLPLASPAIFTMKLIEKLAQVDWEETTPLLIEKIAVSGLIARTKALASRLQSAQRAAGLVPSKMPSLATPAQISAFVRNATRRIAELASKGR